MDPSEGVCPGEEAFQVSLVDADIGDWATGCVVCKGVTSVGVLLCSTCIRDPVIRQKALKLRNEWGSEQLKKQTKSKEERILRNEHEIAESKARSERNIAKCAAQLQALSGATVLIQSELGSNDCPRCIAKKYKNGSYNPISGQTQSCIVDCDTSYIDPRLQCNRCLPNSK